MLRKLKDIGKNYIKHEEDEHGLLLKNYGGSSMLDLQISRK